MPDMMRLDDGFRRVCERLRTPIWVYDHYHKRMAWGNSAAVWLWKRTSLQHFVSVVLDTSAASDARLESIFERLQSGPTDFISEQWTFYPNNQPMTTTCDISLIQVDDDPQRKFPTIMVQAQTTDLTASPAVVENLRNVEMMRHLPVSVAMYESAEPNLVIMQNPTSLRLFGVEHKLYELFEDPHDAKDARDAIKHTNAYRGEVRVRSSDGTAYHAMEINVSKDPLSGKDQLLVYQVPMENFNFVRDLRRAQQEAVAANEAKTRFLSMVSHEIRTPLHGILGFAELLESTPLTDEQSSYLDMLRMSGRALLSIINDILQLSRIEAGKMELSWAPLCLREVLDEITSIILGAARLSYFY